MSNRFIKVSDEEHQALGGGPIVTVDRYVLEILANIQ